MSKPITSFSILAVGLVVILSLALVWLTKWNPFLIWLIAVNLVTFIMYGYDKSQAKIGGTRVPEIVLHGLALAGGFIGGWLGRGVFHHKTRKPIFTIVLALSTIFYLGMAVFYFASIRR
jgi:uncharacterized membrane protein YsdA (DUF1294 family)